MVKCVAKSTISRPLQNSYNEDDEHLIEIVYYIHFKLVLSDICNLNKYANLYITELMFI